MKIDERSVGDVKVLDIAGQIKFTQGDEVLKDKIHSVVHQGSKKILVNLGSVDYVDSAGLGELVAGLKTARNLGASLKILNASARVQQSLYISRLLPIFEIHEDEQNALASFGS